VTPTALVTGASGFIGAHLVRGLVAKGWHVHLLARASSTISPDLAAATVQRYDGSATSLAAIVAETRPTVTFHLASLYLASHIAADIEGLIASNVTLVTQLAEALTAEGAGGRLVTTGTAWQHYNGDDTYRPVNLYAASKQAADTMLRYYVDARELSLITLKLFDTYGADDTRRKLIQLLVDAACSGEVLSMSPGEQIVDLSHVDDVVDAFIACGERMITAPHALDETFFVSGERFRVRDLVPVVEAAMGKPVTANFGGRTYRDRELMIPIDPGVAGRVPGWAPRRKLADAVAGLGEH
jgi:nucleoside-diphosphate-sugar epimerase